MKARSNIPVVTTLFIIGIANAGALWMGFSLIAKSIERQRFYTSSIPVASHVTTLANNRIAVVEGRFLSVYQVDASGKITRLSEVDTAFSPLMPRKH